MEVKPIERTIVEYSLTLSAADADLAVNDPFSFGEKIRDYLLPHMPAAAPKWKPGAASQLTISKNGHSRKGAKKAKAPKAAKGNSPMICESCGRTFKSAGWLKKHLDTAHGTVSAAPSSSTE